MKEKLYRVKLDISNDVTFGLEIEFEDVYMYQIKRALRENDYCWKVYYDYSLKNNGGEVVTPILKDTKKTYVDIKKVCDILKKLNARVDGNASFQIHYSMNIFKDNYKNLINFYKLWSIYENIIYRYSYGISGLPRKTIYDYANMCGKKINEMLKNEYVPFAEYKDGKFIDSIDNYSLLLGNNRNYGLSFRYDDYKNYKDTKTIEIRTINGTIDEVLIQNYIKFFYELLSCSSKENFDEELIEYKYKNIDYSKISINNSTKLYLDEAIELSDLVLADEYDKELFISRYTGDKTLIKKL